MRIQARFLLVFLLVILLLAGWLLIQRHYDREQARLVLLDRQSEKEKLFDRVIALRGEGLEKFVYSEAHRGGLPGVLAALAGGSEGETLAAVLSYYGVDAVWVFDAGGALVFSGSRTNDADLRRPPLPAARLAALAGDRIHFFHDAEHGLLELRGAAVPATRGRPAGGWLLAGTRWDRAALEELGRLTETAVALRRRGDPPPGPAPGPDPENGVFVITRRLPGSSGEPAAELTARGEAPVVRDLNRSARRQDAVIVILALALALLVVVLIGQGRDLLRENAERRRAETALKATLADLETSYRRLQEVQRQLVAAEKLAAIGELSAGVAHELNNPIGIILGYAQLLRKTLPHPDEPIRRQLERLEREAQRCRTIVTNLLEFSRQQPPRLRAVPVRDLLERLRPHLENTARLQGLRLLLAVPDAGLVARTDPEQLEPALLNLVGNAVQAMPRGGDLVIRAEREGERIAIAVSDTGCGIPAENLEKIFTPFFTTKPAGTGLGLAISRKLVENLGGNIRVASEVGRGTTFTVVLPAAENLRDYRQDAENAELS